LLGNAEAWRASIQRLSALAGEGRIKAIKRLISSDGKSAIWVKVLRC
jgi:hypothetical protein